MIQTDRTKLVKRRMYCNFLFGVHRNERNAGTLGADLFKALYTRRYVSE
jgi:hypothetical protein